MRRIRRAWCRLAHECAWMPFRGVYVCTRCLEEWECWK